MQDRVSTYPGRITLTPVTGETDTYDWARADDPTVDGTPLNKATFLPDAVASAIGALTGTTPSLPSEALDALTTALDTMGMTANAKISASSYVGTGSSSARTTTFAFRPRIVFYIKEGGYIGEGRNISTPVCTWQIWVYDSVGGYSITFSYSEANKQLTRTFNGAALYDTAERASVLMNTSGATYYCLAFGVK